MLTAVVLGLAWGGAPSWAAAGAAPGGAGSAPPAGVTAPAAAEIPLTPALTSPPGVVVTMPPVGLSIEYSVMAHDLGPGSCPPAALTSELLRLGSPPIELGGVSQDMTAPAGALPAAPSSWEAATLYPLPVAFWSQLHCLLRATRDPLVAGLNMRTGNLAWAAQMVAGAQSAATAGVSFSLGNEPDLYGLPNYSSLARPAAGEEAAAANLFLQLAAYLRGALGGAAVIGPELARPVAWRNQLPRVLRQLHAQAVGVHLYPLTACRSPREVTIKGLLSARAGNAPARLAWVVAAARAAGLPAIISEANSASCGGRAGVSDTPAAAVWAARFVLSALKTGFREVRFHSSGEPYDPLIVQDGEVLARPLESALVALNEWLPVGSSLHTVPRVHGLLATAVRRPGGGITLILDNQSAQARNVVLESAGSVQLAVLRPGRAGLQTARRRPRGGRLGLSVAANSLLVASTAR
jgi:hypothetical protein